MLVVIAVTLYLAFSLAVPLLLGAALMSVLVPRGVIARRWLVWSAGALLGMLVLPQLMRLVDLVGEPITRGTLTLTVVAGIAAALVLRFTLRRESVVNRNINPNSPASGAARLLVFFLLALLLLRFGALAVEVFSRPLFPWDATMHWATKARVWFEHRSLVPFVDYETWLHTAGAGVYTDRHPHYPMTIPLLQLWMNIALGRWDETLMNLPWLVCFVALGGIFYSQLRIAEVGTTLAVTATYLLLSMPLLNTHVALAGYADLFLASSYGCAAMCLHNWSKTRRSWLLVLAIVFGLFCPLLKNEGFVWTLTLAPAIAVGFMQRGHAARLYLLLVMAGVLLLLLLPPDLRISGYSVRDIHPTFNAAALKGILLSVFLHDSWHLAGYFALFMAPISLLMPGALTRRYLALCTALGSALGAYAFLFVFTGYGKGAENFAAVGRLTLQLAPALLFLITLLYQDLLRNGITLPGQGSRSSDFSDRDRSVRAGS